jgi:hydrogenase-4 component B
MYAEVLFQSLIVILLIAAIVSMALHRQGRTCTLVSFLLSAFASLVGLLLSIDVMTTGPVDLGWSLTTYFGEWTLVLDQLGAFFLLMLCIVMASVSVYSIGYLRDFDGKYDLGLMGALFALFFLSLVLVISASNAILFIIVWECMSVTSYLLVVYENRKEDVPQAGHLYLVMTHMGTALITVAFLTMAQYSGSYDFDSFVGVGAQIPSLAASAIFLLLFLGFGTKAGMIPLHVWLPQAHPAAPSNISALMSGVMVKMALLMMIRGFFEYLGEMQTWWGLLVISVGSVSALLGVLYALRENDIKVALAYSTVENIGIILIALGASMIFQSYGLTSLAALALLGALFQALNHSIFKSLLFLGAGAVVHATNSRNMETMGGLAKKMPYTSVMMLLALLSLAAIPPFAGFVSEWLIFQSLLQSATLPDILVKILIPISIAVLALTGALACALAVRIFGITFLARPRSDQAEHAHESSLPLLLGMSLLASLCVLFGVLSSWLIPYIDDVTASVLGVGAAPTLVDGLVISPGSSEFSTMAPLLIALFLVGLIGLTWLVATYYGGRQERRTGDTWDCGTPLTARNQYTGTALSSPIVRVFSSILRPQSEVRTEFTSSPYVKREMAYQQRYAAVFERYLYRPVSRTIIGVSRRSTVIQAGSIQAYLAYIFATLVLLLIIFR